MSLRAQTQLPPRRSRRSPDESARRRPVVGTVLVLVALLFAVPATAYRIYLKDGTVVAAKDKYRVEGDLALATLENGAQTTIRLTEIDVERTERLNQRAYTSAVVIEGGEERLLSLDDPAMRQKTLAEYVEERRRERAQRAAAMEQQRRPRSVRLTPAGYVDLRTLEKQRVEGALAQTLDETLARHGLSAAQVFQGTDEGRYFVEVVTNNEPSVLAALENLAAAMIDLADSGAGVEALEVYMANESGSRAGMFTFSEDNAALLASDRIEPEQFFLQFVEF